MSMQKCVAFGVRYYLEGDKLSWLASFYAKIIHPVLVNPRTGEALNETIEEKSAFLNQENFDYYHLEHDWEMQPGTWTFQVIQHEIILLEKSFRLTR